MPGTASSPSSSAGASARVLRSGRVVRSREHQREFEDKLFHVLGIVGGLGFWEAWRLPLVCRELRFGFSGGGAPADMIKLGLEKRGVWAKLREARAARRGGGGWTRLHDACEDDVDDVQRVCEVIELGWPGSVEARDIYGCTPLMRASLRGHAGIVKPLLAAGADVNAASNFGTMALIIACLNGHLEAARALVASGANVNAVNQDGLTPLNCARGRNGRRASPAIEALLLAADATAGADWVESAGEGEDEEDDNGEEEQGGDDD